MSNSAFCISILEFTYSEKGYNTLTCILTNADIL